MQRSKVKKLLLDTGLYVLIVNVVFFSIIGYKNFFDQNSDETKTQKVVERYGFTEDDHVFIEAKVQPNQILANLLMEEGVSYETIKDLFEKSKGIFNVNNIVAGLDYTLIKKDSCGELLSFVYEPDIYNYVVCDFRDSVTVKKIERDFEVQIESAQGFIESSLWNSMADIGLDWAVIGKMEEALGAQVDFHRVQQGDFYKLLFERKYIEGQPVGIGNIIGAYYENDRPHYAIYWESGEDTGYYDELGNSSKKSFLKAPVKFIRISSKFSYNRLHPVHKRHRPHFGTDYAAPRGTPIHSVADGVVVEKGYGSGNGNYIKVKHDKSYATSYLHMSRFAKGIRKGSRVSQGQTIGYVGSTGLATGPHVCFRMTKNNKPVNHLREKLPSMKALPHAKLQHFFVHRDSIMQKIDEIGTPATLALRAEIQR